MARTLLEEGLSNTRLHEEVTWSIHLISVRRILRKGSVNEDPPTMDLGEGWTR